MTDEIAPEPVAGPGQKVRAKPKPKAKTLKAKAPKPASKEPEKADTDASRELPSAVKAAGMIITAAGVKEVRNFFDRLLGALEEGDKKPSTRKKG